MFKELAKLDKNLRRAGYILLAVVLGGFISRAVATPVQLGASCPALCLDRQPSGGMVPVASGKAPRAQCMAHWLYFIDSRSCLDRVLQLVSRVTSHQTGFIAMRPDRSFKPMPIREST